MIEKNFVQIFGPFAGCNFCILFFQQISIEKLGGHEEEEEEGKKKGRTR
jgi:hypothetical protein